MPRVFLAKRIAVDVMVAKASDIMNHAKRYLNVSGIRLYNFNVAMSEVQGSDHDGFSFEENDVVVGRPSQKKAANETLVV
jgi:hypothetical protein